MALTIWDYLMAWSLAGLWLSYRTKELPKSEGVAFLLIVLMGPMVWMVALGAWLASRK